MYLKYRIIKIYGIQNCVKYLPILNVNEFSLGITMLYS